MKFLCEQCKAKYQIADEKAAGKTVRMKCRKCGYLIEVRAAATESGGPPATVAQSTRPPPDGGPSKPAPRPPAPRQAAPTQSLGAGKAPAKPAERGSPLSNALKSALHRDEEVSAPVDMSDVSPNDEWYVAVNGVPVGPIRIGEVRRKAAVGAVTEESLCWQEGLDEWRPLRSFPELAAIVREAARPAPTPGSPPSDGRSSLPPAARPSARPGPPGSPPRAPPPRPGPANAANPANGSTAAPLARNNVVPITSRLATAEKLAQDVDDLIDPVTAPAPKVATALEDAVVPDPFAPPKRSAAGPIAGGISVTAAAGFSPARSSSASISSLPITETPAKKGPPWMAIATVASATAFGATAAIAIFLKPAPPPPSVVVQVPAATAAATVGPAATAPADTAEPAASVATTTTRAAAAMGTTAARTSTNAAAGSSASTTPAVTHGPLDFHSFTGSTIAPTEENGGPGDSPKAPGQCISEGQVQQVIGLHSVGLRRTCWERSTTQKLTANVTVSLTIGADGSAQGVSASGDEPSVASCIANDVRGWHFAAMGCSQKTAIPFHFVRQ